jgi:hypothetical protein
MATKPEIIVKYVGISDAGEDDTHKTGRGQPGITAKDQRML